MPAIFIARQMIKQLGKQENCLENGETTGGMEKLLGEQWYFVSKVVLTHCEKKKCSSDREKLLKLEAEP